MRPMQRPCAADQPSIYRLPIDSAGPARGRTAFRSALGARPACEHARRRVGNARYLFQRVDGYQVESLARSPRRVLSATSWECDSQRASSYHGDRFALCRSCRAAPRTVTGSSTGSIAPNAARSASSTVSSAAALVKSWKCARTGPSASSCSAVGRSRMNPNEDPQATH